MMRKLICFLLTITLLASCTALADGYDLAWFDGSSLYEVTLEDDVAFVSVADEATADIAFAHCYEHPDLYSYIYSDVIVLDPGTSDVRPVMRIWIEYRGTQPLHATSVTFTVQGKDYTFNGVDMKEGVEENDGGYSETLRIRADASMKEFLKLMTDMTADVLKSENLTLENVSVPFVIHGDEDVASVMSGYSAFSIGSMYLAMFGQDDVWYLADDPNNVTTMQVSSIQ